MQCGICSGVCPMTHSSETIPDGAEQPECFAARHNDPNVLQNSTSGGAFTAIATAFCDANYAVFGAAMGNDLVVRHLFIYDVKDLWVFRKSKYVQSDLCNCYTQAKRFLDTGMKVLFSGTPCQIAGLRKFLGKPYSTLLCVEVICHGVPSPKVFDVYKNHLEQKYKN